MSTPAPVPTSRTTSPGCSSAAATERVYDYIGFLKEVAEIVPLNPLFNAPIRDANDIIVIQTAIVGEADVLCTRDKDFFEKPASEYLDRIRIAVLDGIALIHRLRS